MSSPRAGFPRLARTNAENAGARASQATSSLVTMLQAANRRHSYNPAHVQWGIIQGEMRSRLLIIVEVGSEGSTERGVIYHR
jgi:hypothetical protein